jgi:hypothetical protein
LPTVLRGAVDGIVDGLAFTPYVPFVLIAAAILDWRHAFLVSLASAGVADWMYFEQGLPGLDTTSDAFGIGIFLGAAVLVILLLEAVKRAVTPTSLATAATPAPGGVIFSAEKGKAFASWSNGHAPVCLGTQQHVEEMMRDFLAQAELGRRLTGQNN